MKEETLRLFVTCPAGFETLLKEELDALGALATRETVTGVFCQGNHADIYTICLWSRLANRVLLVLAEEKSGNAQHISTVVSEISWEQHLRGEDTIRVDFSGKTPAIRHTQYGAQLVKDGIVDRMLALGQQRPNVDLEEPDQRINVRITKSKLYVSLDLSGDSLHKRGYRGGHGFAPLKENLAAALLLRAKWPEHSANNEPLIDPMCGSGTFLIEAAMMHADIAPGVLRARFGFENWLKFRADVWDKIKADALKRKEAGLSGFGVALRGYEIDAEVAQHARENIERAGMADVIHIETGSLDQHIANLKEVNPGLVICNPPYGLRLGDIETLPKEYLDLSELAKSNLPGWRLGVLSSNAQLLSEMRMRFDKKYKFFNGPIACELRLFQIHDASTNSDSDQRERSHESALSEGAAMVANRLRKNLKRLKPWMSKENIECYRVYDADLPEYAAAVDVYGSKLHIQEYQAPKSVDANKAKTRFRDLVRAVKNVYGVNDKEIYIKVRKVNKGKDQYQKHSYFEDGEFVTVHEGKASLLVNLKSYLDTGLFLDHRPLRTRIESEALGKRFLNLFSYTSSATVRAILGGASNTVSVDMSNTYNRWSKLNFEANNITNDKHQILRADVFDWLRKCRTGFDLIMLDPPSFSNSKKMERSFDVQRDHVELVNRCMDILTPDGVLYFSNNFTKFKLDPSLEGRFHVEDITEETFDPDFSRNTKIHCCFKIEHKK